MAFLSEAMLRIAPSATVAISRKAADMKRAGRDVISLAAGEPDFDTPLNVREAAIRAMDEGKTRYTNVDGIPELKEAVARKFKRDNDLDATPDEFMVSLGRQADHLQRAAGDAQSGRRGGDPGAVLGELSRDRAAVRRDAGVRGGRRLDRLQADARGARGGDHAEDQMADPQHAVEPDRARPIRRPSSRG